jgi:hypothetical protein
MTCSRNFGRLLQVGCLGLIGALTAVGCGGSESKPTIDGAAGNSGEVGPSKLPQLNAAQPSVSLGSIDLNKPSTAQTVIITNVGGAPATLTTTPSGAGIAATGCTGSLAVNASCTLSITGTPTVAGQFSGSVSVSAQGGNTVTISVTGLGVPAGNFTLDKSAIDLKDVAVGQTVQASVTVTAGSNLTGLSTGVQGADLKVDASSTCTTSLNAGLTCTVVVNFTSTTAGSPTGDFIVVSQGGVTKSVPVTATVLTLAKLNGTPPSAALTANQGASSQAVTINVGNVGGMTTGQIAVAIAGANAADFKVQSDTCSITTLVSGATCSVSVVYTAGAAAVAASAGTLTITDKGAGASVVSVALTGTPIIPSTLSITPPTGDLGSVSPGATGTEVVFTITNNSATASGALTPSVGNANVAISSGTCAAKATLNKGDTCTVGVKLAPPASATSAAISTLLTVAGTGVSVSAALTGTIVGAAALSVNPTPISFGSIPVNQQSAVKTVTITNTGATATGVLAATMSGVGFSQVTLTGTCTASLAPGKTCTVSAQYSPTDTTGVSATITVSDGAVSVAIPMSGTGLTPSLIQVVDGDGYPKSTANFGSVIKGYTSTPAQTFTVKATGTTTDSGTILPTVTGTEFVVSKNNCTTALQPGATCTFEMTFTPSDVGARTAVLTVTGSKGGVWTVQLSGTGLGLIQLIPVDANSTATPPVTGLDFGSQPNGTAGTVQKYRAVIRGVTTTSATTTTPTIALTTGTTPDYRYVASPSCESDNCDAITNPCNGVAIALPPTGTTSPWVTNVSTPDPAGNAADGLSTNGYWTCDFYVQFYPQTGKSTAPKTATLNATTTSSTATANLSLTGIASGPLAFNGATTVDFGSVAVGDVSDAITLTVLNKGASGVNQGKLTVALSGANAGEFGIVEDNCTAATAATGNYLTPSGAGCTILVALAPATTGDKAATLTVTAGSSSETATVSLTGKSPTGAGGITVSPMSTATVPVPFAPVAQGNNGDWKTFTITNGGTAVTGKLTFTLPDGSFYHIYTIADGAYPTGACGATSTKQLDPGANCTIQVRLVPGNSNTVSDSITDTLTVTDPNGLAVSVALQGSSTPQLTLTGADVTLDDNGDQQVDFKQVGSGATATKTVTITNNAAAGSTAVTLHVSTLPTQYSFDQTAGNCVDGSTLAAQSTCQMKLVYTGKAASAIDGDPDGGTIYISNVSPAASDNNVVAPLILTGVTVQPATLVLYGFGDYVSGTPSTHIDLGAAALGTSTGVVTLVFKNTGEVAANGIQTAWANGSSADFTIAAESQGTCFSLGGTLAAGATCTINVRCTPSGSVGARSATLQFFATAITGQNVTLHATGLTVGNSVYAVQYGQTNTFYTYGTTGATAAKAYFTLTNNDPTTADSGGLNLGTNDNFTSGSGNSVTASDVTIASHTAADFTLSKANAGNGTVCGTALAVGSSCTFSVVFAPTWATTDRLHRWAIVTAKTTKVLGLIGQVQMPATLLLTTTATTTPTSTTVDFGQIMQGQVPSVTFTIQNIGEAATTTAPVLTLDNGGSLTYAVLGASTCGTAALQPQATCTAAVNSQLVGAVGQATGISVTATAGSLTSDASFSLQAEVVNPASISLTPSATSYGNTAVAAGTTASNPITITVRNGSTNDNHNNRQDTGVLGVVLSDPTNFAVNTGSSSCYNTTKKAYKSLPLSNPASETCTLVIDFKPTTAGAKSTTVTVTATPGGSPNPITLTGTAAATLVITPTSFTAPQTAFTVTHSGTSTTGSLRSVVTGTNAAEFVVTDDGCFGLLMSTNGGTCSVTVNYIGPASPTTAHTATLTVSDSTANNTGTVSLSVGGSS